MSTTKKPFTTDWTFSDALTHIVSRVQVNENGCWEWQGSRTKDGYGQFGSKHAETATGQKLVHRAMVTIDTGFIFTSRHQQAMHSCHNRSCCNPAHLSVGTAHENMAQARERGSWNYQRRCGTMAGEANPRTLYTNEFVRTIKRMLAEGFRNIEIERLMDVPAWTVSDIRAGKSWKSVTI